MAELVPISGIRPDHLEKELVVRGRVIRTISMLHEATRTREPLGIQIQEVSTQNRGSMPRILECFCDDPIDFLSGCYVEVKGVLTALRGKQSTLSRVVLQKCQVSEISREDSMMEELMKLATWFTPENLKETRNFESSRALITFLNEKAECEGFQLVRKRSEKEDHLTLRCHQHSRYNKLKELNENYDFWFEFVPQTEKGPGTLHHFNCSTTTSWIHPYLLTWCWIVAPE